MFELLTKRQRKCRMTTKIPLTFREPTWWMGRVDPEMGEFRGFSPNSPPPFVRMSQSFHAVTYRRGAISFMCGIHRHHG